MDNLREDQIRLAEEGERCRQFMAGVGGAAVKQMREVIIEKLTALGPKQDEERFRLSVALKVTSDFTDTILRCVEQGQEAEQAVKEWLALQDKKRLLGLV